MPLYLDGPVIRQNQALEDFSTPFRTYVRAKLDDALDNNVTPLLLESARMGDGQTFDEQGMPLGEIVAPPARLDATTARQKAKNANVAVTVPDDGISGKALDIMIDRKRRQRAYEDAINRSPTGLRSAAGVGASFLGGALDPLNLASAFVPVVGEARYSLMLARATGALGRASVRAGVGAVEGLAGMALLEPATYAAHQSLQDDYKALDSIVNIGFGGVLGGGLHVAGGAVRDVLQPGRWSAARAAHRALPDMETDVAATNAVMTQHSAVIAAGEPVTVLDRALDLPEIADTPRPLVMKLADPEVRADLTAMRGETGWQEHGGRLIVNEVTRHRTPGTGEILGRTAWVPNAEWWPGRPDGMSEDAVRKAIDKALSGKRLGAAEQRTVEYLIDYSQARRDAFDFAPTADELLEEGLAHVDAFDTSLVARAAALDEGRVDRLAIQYENDDAAFMRGIKELLDEHSGKQSDQDAAIGGGSEARESAPRSAETVRAADFHQRETALRAAVAQSVDGRTVNVAPIFDASARVSDAVRSDSRLADSEASRQAAERLSAAPKSDDLKSAQAELDATMRDLEERWAAAGRDPEALNAIAPELEAMTRQADELARAARAAAMCDVGAA